MKELFKITLTSEKEVTTLFRQQGIDNFDQAIAWMHKLPYGRNSDRTNYLLIFDEYKGTCSTKHAALAALASENRIDAKLQLAICKLTAIDQPKLGRFLHTIGSDYFPEAHCYLKVDDQKIDITFPGNSSLLQAEILEEYTILPTQIGEYRADTV